MVSVSGFWGKGKWFDFDKKWISLSFFPRQSGTKKLMCIFFGPDAAMDFSILCDQNHHLLPMIYRTKLTLQHQNFVTKLIASEQYEINSIRMKVTLQHQNFVTRSTISSP
jgi:hypothetical protein